MTATPEEINAIVQATLAVKNNGALPQTMPKGQFARLAPAYKSFIPMPTGNQMVEMSQNQAMLAHFAQHGGGKYNGGAWGEALQLAKDAKDPNFILQTLTKSAGEVGSSSMQEMSAMLAANSNEPRIERLPNEFFLRSPELMEDFIVERMAPRLLFMEEFMLRRQVDTDDVTWKRNLNTWFEDPLKVDPGLVGEDGLHPDITTTKFEERRATLRRRGFRLRFTLDAVNNRATGFDQMAYDMERAADWFASYINDRNAIVLTNDFDTGQTGDNAVNVEAADVPWSDDDADPIKDIRDLADTFKARARVKPTDLWINFDNFRELLDFLDFASPHWALDPFTQRETLQIDGITIREAPVDGGLRDSFGVMLARGSSPPLISYERDYEGFSRSGLLSVHRHFDDDSLETRFTIFKKWATVLPNPELVGLLHSL